MSTSRSALVYDDPWQVHEQDFPADASLYDQLVFMLNYAVLAPSGHNTQPWLFRVAGEHVDVVADRTRALAVVDPDDRELVMSCGAAVFHLRTTMAHYGRSSKTVPFPEPSDPDLLARVQATGTREPSLVEHRLFMAIKKRRTNRQPFDSRVVPEIELASMIQASAAEGVRLDLFADPTSKGQLAKLIARGDRLQGQNKHFRRELAAWIRPNKSTRRDGIPGYAAGRGDAASLVGPLVVRTFDWGEGQAAKDEQLAHGSPVLAVFSTDKDNAAAWLSTGIALDHVVLLAADYQIQASYLNQPLEVEELRSEVSKLLQEGGIPQIILRLGYGNASMTTPRRSVGDVLIR